MQTRDVPECPVARHQLIDGLFGALRWVEKMYAEVCKRVDLEMLTPYEFIVLRMVARYADAGRSPPVTDLARTLDLDRGYVTRLTRALEGENAVRSVYSYADRRCRSLAITAIGAEFAKVDDLGEELWQLLLADFGHEKARQLAQALSYLEKRPDMLPFW
jgi:DNA-binding MarR family transcriptional regulator